MKKTMLDIALGKYQQTFGVNYPLLIVDCRSDEEIVKEIAACIKNKKKAEQTKYEEGYIY